MTGQPFRTDAGGRIDRARSLSFTFNGKALTGHPGDTLASALLANGTHLVGRSFKYHRPRGILTAGSEEPNALVQLGLGARSEPNLRAPQVELFEGLAAASVNCWPSVGFDVGAVNGLLSRLFPSGFYYKTFMWPNWHLYEGVIRRAAGLGKAPDGPDPDRYDKRHAHCEVLVAGAGPAGLAAALAAGKAGARVILADEQAEMGGDLLSTSDQIGGAPAESWRAATLDELATMPNVRLLPRTTVFGYYDHNYICLAERVTDHLGPEAPAHLPRHRLWKVRARQVVLATGAHERPLVFANNDRPGVMLASAAACYATRYGVRAGSRAVVFTNNDSAYRAAWDLHQAGVAIEAVVDARPDGAGAAGAALRDAGVTVLTGQGIVATHGAKRVTGVSIAPLGDGPAATGPVRDLPCDLVAMSGGWNPGVHLFSQARGSLSWDEDQACFVPARAPQPVHGAGACKGNMRLRQCLEDGAAAGAEAAGLAGLNPVDLDLPEVAGAAEAPIRPLWLVPGKAPLGRGAKHFVDFQNDVTAADVALAHREGFVSVEHLKRYTTTGMGTDQGKTSNVNALAILAEARGEAIPAVGTTTFRQPYTPVSFGALAGRDLGRLADPVRRTAIQSWHEARGAVFEDVGQWKRPFYYPRAGEDLRAAVDRECLAVREGVGMLDASTLGKIDLRGPDVVTLLNRVYTNAWNKLDIGRCRYGLMLGEDGMVMDDGVTTRLGEDHFLMTTTSGNAARVLAWLEEWLQTEWPELKVYANSVTEKWATVTLAGPKARAVLERVGDVELSTQAFPFMSYREGTVAGAPARVFRVSFSGELSYEINVPAHQGLKVWEALHEAGQPEGITPYGTEAMHVLRAEKGYIIVGQETDGTVTPLDLGMDWIVSKKKDFLGRRSLTRSDTARDGRKQLVGLATDDPGQVLQEGAQIIETPDIGTTPVPMIGHVSSSYWSAALGRSIALALVRGGRDRMESTVHVSGPSGAPVPARVVSPVFYDPEGARLDG